MSKKVEYRKILRKNKFYLCIKSLIAKNNVPYLGDADMISFFKDP